MRRWVRTAEERDVSLLVHLYRDHHLQPVEQRFFLEKIRKDEIFVVLEDQAIRGYVLFSKTGFLELPTIQEPILYREEEHHGFDTKLLVTVEAYLKRLGFRKLVISCDANDRQAILRNKNLGYAECGVVSHLRADGKDEMVMVKNL